MPSEKDCEACYEKLRKKQKAKRVKKAGKIKKVRVDAQDALSRVIPKIQYNFPAKSEFGDDLNRPQSSYIANRSINYGRDTVDYGLNSVPIMRGPKFNDKQNLAQQTDKGFPKSQFTENNKEKSIPLEVGGGARGQSGTRLVGRDPLKEVPINHPDKTETLIDGFDSFERNEESSLTSRKSYAEEEKEENKNIKESEKRLKSERKKAIKEAKRIEKEIEKENKKLQKQHMKEFDAIIKSKGKKKAIDESFGMSSVPLLEDEKKSYAPIMNQEQTQSVPLMNID